MLTKIVVLLTLVIGAAAGPALAITTSEDPYEYITQPGQSQGLVQLFRTDLDGNLVEGVPCSGALLAGEPFILTAAHCVTDGNGQRNALSVSIYFQSTPNAPAMVSGNITVHPTWTGYPTTSDADLALIMLSVPAPADMMGYYLARSAPEFYQLPVLIEGWGASGQGGDDPSVPHESRLGTNHYDESLSPAPDDVQPWHRRFSLFDFDDGSDVNNVIGEPGWVTYEGPDGPYKSITRLDLDLDGDSVLGEAMVSSGDSGGPTSTDGLLLGIHSWSQAKSAFGELGGDGRPDYTLLDQVAFAGHGTIAGDVQVWRYADWIDGVIAGGGTAATVPLPASGWLLLTGIGLVGARWRKATG